MLFATEDGGPGLNSGTDRRGRWPSRERRPRGGRSILAILLFLALWRVDALAATFTATLDRPVITLGESATLSLVFSEKQPKNPPSPPPIAGLRIAYVGPSSQITILNGAMSSVVTHVFTVTPSQPGEFTIPAITADVEGQKMSSQPLKLLVNKPGAPPPDAVNAGTQLAFMRLSLAKTNLFLNETTTGELQLYLNQQVRNLSGFQLTAVPAEGFVMSKFAQGQTRRAQVGNAVYTMVPFGFVLRPARTGSLVVGPVTASVALEIASARSKRRDPFYEQFGMSDPFDMLAGTTTRQTSIATDGVAVNSQPLPGQNVPEGFTGAVGDFKMAASAGPTNVTVGDPITVKVQITGRGALDTLALPEQSGWKDFKAYPPTSKVETTDQLGAQGSKAFEQIVTPLNANVKELPPIVFSYFDPEAGAYRTLREPPVRLIVRPAAAVPAPTVSIAARADAPVTPDIVHIKQRLGQFAQAGAPLMLRPSFMAAQTIPVLAFLAAYGFRKRAESLARNPRLRRKMHVAQITRAGLAELRQLAASADAQSFFSTMFRLLQEQLGERLDMPSSAITEAVIDEKLRPSGAPPALIEDLHQLFQACNVARYAPSGSPAELESFLPRVETVLKQTAELTL